MITLQMMKGTGPYNQMQRYIADVHKDLTPQQRAGKFTALLKKYVNNQNKHKPEQNAVPKSLLASFPWVKSPEGGMFWNNVSKYKLDNAPEVKPQPVVAEQPKPAAPALVWPKGATHYRPDLKRFFNVGGQWDVNGDMKWYEFMGARTYEQWSVLPQTIKRPETPLPNGLQWEEGYTHFTPEIGAGAFLKEDGFKFVRGVARAWINDKAFPRWLKHENTIQRYPDNQPLILRVPPRAPVMPVEALVVGAVGQPGPVENVAPKAPVEAPKPKKQVGWWS